MNSNKNYPYSHLYIAGNGAYFLSVIVDMTERYEIRNDLNKDITLLERQLEFKESNLGVAAPQNSYFVKSPSNATVTKTFTIEGGEINKSELRVQDASVLQLPDIQRYVPHLYFSKTGKGSVLRYHLYLAIPTIPSRRFKLVKDEISDKDHILKFQEYLDNSFQTDICITELLDMSELDTLEKLIVEVHDIDADLDNAPPPAPKAKGTVRHSAADIKPFDLLGCD